MTAAPVNRPLLIRGARVIDPSQDVDRLADVLIRGGNIAELGTIPSANEFDVIEASGLTLAPGLVDLHCHLRDPGQEYRETIATGTAAAARGGFTTICCMPNTEPAIDNRSVVEYIQRTARREGLIRVLPIGAVSKGRAGQQLAEMGELAEAGVVGFSDDGSPVASASLMRHALEYASIFDLPVIDHCEEPSLTQNTCMHEGWVSNLLGLPAQPSAAEEIMVARDIQLADLTGGRLHLAHVSAAGSVEQIRSAKARGVRVTAEVTPHHLFLTHEAILGDSQRPPYDTNARVNPPLRDATDAAACLQGLIDGTIDCIATDHAPHDITDKLCEFDQAAPGISGLETALAIVLTLVSQGLMPLQLALRRLSFDALRTLGTGRAGLEGLGTLSIGSPADLVLFDDRIDWKVDPSAFVSRGKNSPLAGRTLRGRVMATFAAGTPVYVDDRFRRNEQRTEG